MTFSHASIRDYLELEGYASSRRWHDLKVTVGDWSKAHLSVAICCIKIMNSVTPELIKPPNLRKYCKIFYMEHLNQTELSSINARSASADIQLIADLFCDGELLLRSLQEEYEGRGETIIRDNFVYTWFGTSLYSSKIRQLFRISLDGFVGEKKQWAESVICSARMLFKPLISVCRRRWLVEPDLELSLFENLKVEVCILLAYSTLVSFSSITCTELIHLDGRR